MFPVFLQFQQLFPQCLSIVFGRCLPLQRTSSGCFPCSWKNTGEWLTTLGFQHLCKRCLFLPIVRCFITGVLATPMPHTNVSQNTAMPSITVFFQATDSVHKLRKNLSIIRGGWRETTSVFVPSVRHEESTWLESHWWFGLASTSGAKEMSVWPQILWARHELIGHGLIKSKLTDNIECQKIFSICQKQINKKGEPLYWPALPIHFGKLQRDNLNIDK